MSEAHFESCINESEIIKQNNLNISKIPGFPFISNSFQKIGYANFFRSLSNWQYSTEVDNIKVDEVKCGDIIFVTQHFVNYFWEIYHKKIKSKYILISHESDYPAGYPWHQMYLDHKNIGYWFAQNVVAKHPKLEPIPIGILPSPIESFDTLYDTIKNNVVPYFSRTILLYLNISPGTNKNRTDTIQFFKTFFNENSTKVIIDESRIHWKHYLWKLGNSQFVLSPPGNGIDCFRTWESLAMGAVPIVLKSELQPLYDDMPVMVVNDWNEVTEESMKNFSRNKLTEFDKDGVPLRPKLWVRYWINRISNFRSKFIKDSC
uniref:Exostosin GT47 domain-containing protein n=2 Tax=Panagrolaimus davidi TaxID=227884 RepID=A0A914P8P4_9BILA